MLKNHNKIFKYKCDVAAAIKRISENLHRLGEKERTAVTPSTSIFNQLFFKLKFVFYHCKFNISLCRSDKKCYLKSSPLEKCDRYFFIFSDIL